MHDWMKRDRAAVLAAEQRNDGLRHPERSRSSGGERDLPLHLASRVSRTALPIPRAFERRATTNYHLSMPVETELNRAPTSIRAPRGNSITCKGWQQEAAMRMLMNNLDEEVAERPQDLVVYGGTGRAARSWEACHHRSPEKT
jgi:hypothetical protein